MWWIVTIASLVVAKRRGGSGGIDGHAASWCRVAGSAVWWRPVGAVHLQ